MLKKLNQYFSSVRELEQRLEREEKNWDQCPSLKSPDGIPGNYKEHIGIMFDMMALAFQSDSTRISSFLLAHDGSNRSFRDIGVPEGHHSLSHHKNDPEKMKKLARIDQFYSEQFAYFLNRLSTIREIDGSRLIDHCMIVFGGGISDGNRHRHSDLPVVLAGGKSHGLSTGRHVDYGSVPMTNLFLGILERAGIQASQVGDSTGILTDI